MRRLNCSTSNNNVGQLCRLFLFFTLLEAGKSFVIPLRTGAYSQCSESSLTIDTSILSSSSAAYVGNDIGNKNAE